MRVRALKQQLFLAVLSVIAAFFALSAATYAWYASKNDVSANGMSISAVTEGMSFEITATWDEAEGEPLFVAGKTSASCMTDPSVSVKMFPVHPKIDNDLSDLDARVSWWHSFSLDYDDANIDNAMNELSLSVDTGDHTLKSSNDEVYALVADFYVRLNPVSTSPNTILSNIVANNIVITDNSTQGQENLLSKCLYLVVEGEAGAYQIANEASFDDDNPFTAATVSGNLIDLLTVEDEYKRIRVYAFFEGQDVDCKSSQYSAETISVSLGIEGELGTKE